MSIFHITPAPPRTQRSAVAASIACNQWLIPWLWHSKTRCASTHTTKQVSRYAHANRQACPHKYQVSLHLQICIHKHTYTHVHIHTHTRARPDTEKHSFQLPRAARALATLLVPCLTSGPSRLPPFRSNNVNVIRQSCARLISCSSEDTLAQCAT